MTDPNPEVSGRGIARLRAAGIEVETGLLESDARKLNRGFVSRMTRGRPWLTLKLAASLDGRTAMASGESQWITGANARADVHRLRAAAGCVMTGGATVLADDPQLTVRLPADDGVVPAGFRQPDRVVLDSSARVPLTAKVWHGDVRRFWLVSRKPSAKPDGVEAIEIDCSDDGSVRLPAALTALANCGVNEILLECGPRLAGALDRRSTSLNSSH